MCSDNEHLQYLTSRVALVPQIASIEISDESQRSMFTE